MNVYLDTSVFLRWLLNNQKIYSGFQKWKSCYTSELFYIEVSRVLNRLRLEKVINDKDYTNLIKTFSEFYKTIYVVEMNKTIKEKSAEFFPTIIGTLDAIHLSTAITLRSENPKLELVFLTHDKQLSNSAEALGFRVNFEL